MSEKLMTELTRLLKKKLNSFYKRYFPSYLEDYLFNFFTS